MTHHGLNRHGHSPPWRFSIRYKLALPVLILVTLMLLMLFRTTFRTVRAVVLERNESRLQAITDAFAETVKVPLILRNHRVLLANIDWMSQRADVLKVSVEDAEGVLAMAPTDSERRFLPPVEKDFLGVKRVGRGIYAAAAPIKTPERRLGRVLIFFTQKGFEAELQEIFERRLMLAFTMAFILAVLTSGITWLAIRPLFTLKRTVQEILSGDLGARARINSFDEIQDLGEAFNEMVARLAKSLDNLRARTEALEESEEKYRLIVENSSDIIFMLTPEGELSLLNKDISGCTREELLLEGLPLFLKLHDEESLWRFEESLERVCETKQAVTNVPLKHVHRTTKAEIFYLLNLTPVLDHEGSLKLIQGVLHDVTELRRIEMMKDSLIRDVAHELKTPTAKFEMAVSWFENELNRTGEMEKYREILTILKSSADRLMRTITSIMDLSKLESGTAQIQHEEINLNDVLEQVRQDMEPICGAKNLKLAARFSREPLWMRGDRDMLYRLFVNLIGNAVKFTASGTIALTSGRADGRIQASVRDSGMGIEKADLERIFERFVQKTASSLGIGVGLTISRDIAALHEGRIWAESEGPGQGATFKVEFPELQRVKR